MSYELREIVRIAEDAVRAAGEIQRRIWLSGDIAVNHRERHDVKLVADVSSEDAILGLIRRARPDDGTIAEESGEASVSRAGVWIVDPLDGTVNFSHGHPHFCTSVGWCWEGRLMVGAVYDAMRDELFTGARGQGAWLNGKRLHASATRDLDRAMLAVGFGKIPEHDAMAQIGRLASQVQKLRISGSAALDLVYTACGRLDGYCETRVFVWDLAAGALILEEAGGICQAWPTKVPWQRECVATAPGLAVQVGALITHTPERIPASWVQP